MIAGLRSVWASQNKNSKLEDCSNRLLIEAGVDPFARDITLLYIRNRYLPYQLLSVTPGQRFLAPSFNPSPSGHNRPARLPSLAPPSSSDSRILSQVGEALCTHQFPAFITLLKCQLRTVHILSHHPFLSIPFPPYPFQIMYSPVPTCTYVLTRMWEYVIFVTPLTGRRVWNVCTVLTLFIGIDQTPPWHWPGDHHMTMTTTYLAPLALILSSHRIPLRKEKKEEKFKVTYRINHE